MRRVVVAAVALAALAGTANAKRRPPPKPASAPTIDPWAGDCGQAFTAASEQLAKKHRAFRGAHADAVGPVDTPAQGSPGMMPTPPVKRLGSAVRFDLQLRSVPEYFYADVIDVRDDHGDWAPTAGDGEFACVTHKSGKQHNVHCVMRRGDHLAVVRAIHWRRSPRVAPYLRAFQAAATRCLP